MSVPDADAVVLRARAAQREWASVAVSERVRVLRELRRRIAAERVFIVNAVVDDTQKPALDALSGDVLVTLEQMRFYERHAANLLAPRKIKRSSLLFAGCRFQELLEPHGVALVYGPANYPFQLAMVPAITALYAGNAVVLKISERTPAVASVIRELCRDVLPEHLLQVVEDGPETAANYIEASPDLVFFTGSTVAGRAVAARAAARLIPTVLELGGKDAALVFADCNFPRTVEGVVYGAFSNAGQVCVGIKRLYLEQTIADEFLHKLRARLETIQKPGSSSPDFGRLADSALRTRLQEQVQDALEGGANLVAGEASHPDAPIVMRDVPSDAKLLREESFGPVLCVSTFRSEQEAIELANSSEFALSASVWTRDMARARRVTSALNAGSCAVNDVIRNIANPQASFGGNGASGYGRYHGAVGLQAFSRVKTVMTTQSQRTSEMHWFPLSEWKQRGLDTMIALRQRPQGWHRGLMRAMRRIFLLALAASAAMHGGFAVAESMNRTAVPAGHLLLHVLLPPHAHGRAAYAIFTSSQGFPNDAADSIRHEFSKPVTDTGAIDIDAGPLQPGRYAVSVYLDENGNHKLDTALFGIPREPVGASNNPRSRFGPPRFDACAFSMSDKNKTISIRLVEPK